MKLTAAVLVKHVPVGGAFLRIAEDRLTRVGVSHGLDPINEVALEWAIAQRESGAIERVVVITIGPAGAADTLRRCMAMGADEGVLVTDDRLAGADVRQTARALAGAIRQIGADLALLGYESLDGSSGAVPGAVAALLDAPLLSRVRSAEITEDGIQATRDLGSGPELVAAGFPVVASFVEGDIIPRFPKVKDVIRTKNAELTTLDAAQVGAAERPARREAVTGLRDTPVPPKEPEILDAESGIDRILQLLDDAGVRS